MAEAQELLRQQEALEEQEWLAAEAEAEQRRVQRMELIQQKADFERERDKCTNRLRRNCNQTLSQLNFGRMEDLYIALMNLDSRLSLRINDWEELLNSDESGNPIYPDRGMPEYR